MQKSKIRRMAAHWLMMPDGQCRTQWVVEIRSGRVSDYYPLKEELPFTEWLNGTIQLEENADGSLSAFYEGKMIE